MGEGGGVGLRHAVGNHHERAAGQRVAHPAGVRQADRRIGGHNPQRLDLPRRHGVEHVDRPEAGSGGDARAAPEPLNPGAGGVVEVHVAGQRGGHAAGFAPAHGVGLAGDRERRRARLADAPGGQVNVEDRRALGDPLGRLVGAHGKQADGPGRVGEQAKEGLQVSERQAAVGGDGVGRLIDFRQFCLHLGEACHVGRHIGSVHAAAPHQVSQQAVPQAHVGLGRQRQMQVSHFGGVGAARVDDHMALTVAARGLHAAEQHRVGPGGVVAGEHHQIGEVQVLVAARHQVGAERQLVGHHRRGHAQPRIGVDVPRADEPLHQFVGRVVILGQKLPGNVEGHRVRAVAGDGLGEASCHETGGLGPGGAAAGDHRMQQAAFQAGGRTEGAAFGT